MNQKSLKAAVRETCEETGLKPGELGIVNGFKTVDRYYFSAGGKKIFKIVVFYLAETKNRSVSISEEHYGFGWFLYRDAMKILGRYKGSKKVLKEAYDFLRRKSSARHPAHPAR